MKLFGIFGRRFLQIQRGTLPSNLSLMMTASTVTYLSYQYLEGSSFYRP